VSANIAVIYAGELTEVAQAFGEAAGHLAADVRLRRLAGTETPGAGGPDKQPILRDLEWANGIAFGTPVGDGAPAPELMRFIESTDPHWSRSRLGAMYDKAVTVFTDEPEHMAPDSVLHPIYDALYRWGAVIIGPRGFELEIEAWPGHDVVEGSSTLSASRLRSARYRAYRLARLASVLADEHHRKERLTM
jgi:NAD(P)H dehydrogenase (quinone)